MVFSRVLIQYTLETKKEFPDHKRFMDPEILPLKNRWLGSRGSLYTSLHARPYQSMPYPRPSRRPSDSWPCLISLQDPPLQGRVEPLFWRLDTSFAL